MNDLLRKHGCNTIFTMPEGMQELMSDISREVLREQPTDIYKFIANYLSALLVTREHGILAVKILDDLCDCKPTTIEHLVALGLEHKVAGGIAEILQREIEVARHPAEGDDKVKEANILKKVLLNFQIDEQMAVKICQVIRNAYKDYWYRKKLLAKRRLLQEVPEESWEKAVEHTLRIYKTTKPSIAALQQATKKIQAAYKAYYIRKRTLSTITKHGNSHKYAGPPVDIAASREIDLGPLIAMHPKTDDVSKLMEAHRHSKKYDPLQAIQFRPDAVDDNDSDTNSDHPSLEQMNVDLRKASEPYQFDINVRKEDSSERRASKIPNTPNTSFGEIPGTKLISFAQVPVEIDPESKEDIPEEITYPREDVEVISEVDDDAAAAENVQDDHNDDTSLEISTDMFETVSDDE